MSLPDMHPYAGRATTLKRAMSSTDSPGATPHSEGHPWAEEDVEASRQILRRRLAKKQDRLEERAETVSAQRLRIRELEEEVERMREALRYADDGRDPVYPDFYILESASDLVRDDWPGLADELDTFRQKLIGALDRAEDGQNE